MKNFTSSCCLKLHKLLFLILFFAVSFISYGQTNISGIVNTYTRVTAINQPVCAPCDVACINTITVTNGALFTAGDVGLVIQMKGADINTSNTIDGGKITAINNVTDNRKL